MAQDVEPVPDLRLFQIAEIGIEALEVLILVAGEARIDIEARGFREIEDVAAQAVAAAAVQAGGQVVFIDQGFEILERPVGLGAGQGRRQVVDDDGAGAALGLRAFARIVDDEGIELRQRPQCDLGVAGGGKTRRLAGQPFEIAVLADCG